MTVIQVFFKLSAAGLSAVFAASSQLIVLFPKPKMPVDSPLTACGKVWQGLAATCLVTSP
jgi:hypothetical protein